jgi:hypothetical protein
MNQLSLEADEPGYYSYWASGQSCGTGAVGWFPSAAAAREHAAASFHRGYRSWREDQRPVLQRVDVRLLVAGPDRGRWGDLSQEIRNQFTAHHPWCAQEEAP